MDGEICRIVVQGRVQGVGFRYFTEATAQRLGVAGWVRNLPSGAVEVLARLDASNRDAFLEALRNGPPAARVDDLQLETISGDSHCPPQGFSIRIH